MERFALSLILLGVAILDLFGVLPEPINTLTWFRPMLIVMCVMTVASSILDILRERME